MNNIIRPYTQEQVEKLRGNFQEEYKYSKYVAKTFRHLLERQPFIRALGSMSGNQAIQMAKAGLQSIYCSGWQVAADANSSGHMYPDQSLYQCNSVPDLVKKMNNALRRADQIDYSEGKATTDYFLPIIADAEAGFGGPLNAFELMKAMIEAGAAAVHFEDQLSSAKKCGHLGGKVLVPGSQFIQTLVAARLAADVMDVPTLIIARTDANSAKLLTSDIDWENDGKFISHSCNEQRTSEGFYHITGGLQMAINRGLQYAPYADLLWMETNTPDLDEAKEFANKIHEKFPGKWLAYNCSPSFNWKKKLNVEQLINFQNELGQLGYKFQFVTLAGFHSLNNAMFNLAWDYKHSGMLAYSMLQEEEFKDQDLGFDAVKHQRFVGTGYYDLVSETIGSSLSALKDSTEKEQF